jgi:hypothetical protein
LFSPNDRLDNRRLPLSAVLTRVDIGAVRIGVKQRLHFLAAPEERNGLGSDRNQSPCARISSGPAFPKLYKESSKLNLFISYQEGSGKPRQLLRFSSLNFKLFLSYYQPNLFNLPIKEFYHSKV